MLGDDFSGVAELAERLPSHDPRSDLRERHADGLTDEGDRARRTRVHLDDEDLVPLNGELNVHQADHTELESECLRGGAKLGEHGLRQRVRRKRHRGVAGMNPRLFDVLQQAADDHVGSIRHTVDVHLDGVLQELIDENGLRFGVGDRLEGDRHVARKLFL